MESKNEEKIEEITTHVRPEQVVKTTKVVSPTVKIEHPQVVYQKKKAIFRTHQIIWYLLSIIEVLLLFRIILRVLGANSSSSFAQLIYALSEPFAAPFRGIFGVLVANSNAYFEWSTFLGMIVYILIAAGLVQLLQFFKPVTPQEVEQVVD